MSKEPSNVDTCEWYPDDPDPEYSPYWNSSCGLTWAFHEGGVKENGVKFCPNCGSKVTTEEKDND